MFDDFEAAATAVALQLKEAHDDRVAGRLSQSFAAYQRALDACDAHPQLRTGLFAAYSLHGLGATVQDQGDPTLSLEFCWKAIMRLGQPRGPADDAGTRSAVLTTIGLCFRSLGRLADAHDAYQLAIDTASETPGEPLAMALSNYGALWSVAGDVHQARAMYEEAIKVLDDHSPDSPQRALIEANFGGALRDTGEPVAAVGTIQRALDLHRKAGDRKGAANDLLALSHCYRQVDDIVKAREMIDEALAIVADDAPKSELHVRCLRQFAHVVAAEGDAPRALAALDTAQELIAGLAPASRDAVDVACARAIYLVSEGSVEAAVSAAQAAHDAAEKLRMTTTAGDSRQQLTAMVTRAADILAATLIVRASNEDPRSVVDLIERRQARRLNETIGSRSAEALGADEAAGIATLRASRVEQVRLLQHARWATRAIARGEEAPVDVSTARRAAATARHTLHRIDTALDERLPAPTKPATSNCTEIQAALRPGEAIVYSLMLPIAPTVVTVTHDRVALRQLDADLEDIERRVDAVEADVCSGASQSQALAELSVMLLGDIRDETEQVVVVADGRLHRLPWALLPDPHASEPVGIRRRVTHSASASLWVHQQSLPPSKAPRDLLVLGDPEYASSQIPDPARRRLTGSGKELEAIEQLVPGAAALRGTDATEARLVSELPLHRRVHIACHGFVDEDDARYSGLLLAPPGAASALSSDDILQVWEIAEMQLDCDLAVLSACSAGAGEPVAGEGLIGLIHSLQLAGARQVVAPLWPIKDEVVPDLAKALYRHLGSGLDVDEALKNVRSDFQHSIAPAEWGCWAVHGTAPRAEASSP